MNTIKTIAQRLRHNAEKNRPPPSLKAGEVAVVPPLPIVKQDVAGTLRDWLQEPEVNQHYPGLLHMFIYDLLYLIDFRRIDTLDTDNRYRYWHYFITTIQEVSFKLSAYVNNFHVRILPGYKFGLTRVGNTELFMYSLRLPGYCPVVACLFKLDRKGSRKLANWHMFIPPEGNTLDVEYRKGVPYYTFWPQEYGSEEAEAHYKKKLKSVKEGALTQSITEYINSCNAPGTQDRYLRR